MESRSKSSAYTLELADRALKLSAELGPNIEKQWQEFFSRSSSGEKCPDFGAAIAQLRQAIEALRGRLVVAAIGDELERTRKTRQLVIFCQRCLKFWIQRFATLLYISRFQDEFDSLVYKRSYFRRIRALAAPAEPAKTWKVPPATLMLETMGSLDPKVLFEAHLGLKAISGWPDRPRTPQQERRQRRRRRRNSPGAPSASFRRNRVDDDDDDEE